MAPILIMTLGYSEQVLVIPFDMSKHSWIIFDEIHYLDDYERGTVWEESLIFLPRHMKLLALSATIPNMKELAEWLKFIHERPFHVIEETKRPVPLHMFFQAQGRVVDEINKLAGWRSTTACPLLKVKTLYAPQLRKSQPGGPAHKRTETADTGFRAIYFVFSRKRAEYWQMRYQAKISLT
jgi:superfamily II RNA helicase